MGRVQEDILSKNIQIGNCETIIHADEFVEKVFRNCKNIQTEKGAWL